MEKQIGQTKNLGFQFGIRKTFPISLENAWDFLLSEKGVKIWIGELKNELEIKKNYETKNGISGLVRVLKPNSHIRLNWKRKNWNNMSIIQIRLIENKEKTTIAIHQEKLLNSKQRTEMKEYWNQVMNEITDKMNIVHNEKKPDSKINPRDNSSRIGRKIFWTRSGHK